MVGKSSGTLCGVESPSWEVMEEERIRVGSESNIDSASTTHMRDGYRSRSGRRGSQFTTLRNIYCSIKSMTDIDFGFTGREEF